MKRLLTLLFLLASLLPLAAQKPVADRKPLWVGLDMGGTWQTSDMKPIGGIGWSFTLSRYSRLSKPGALYFGWRFRFMDGRNFGYTYHALTDAQLASEPLLYNGTLNYSASPGKGPIYANYKMHFDEFAFEGIVGSNGLRRHGVLLYAFGGVGMNYWKTKTNQMDMTGELYNYSNINPSLGQDQVHTQLSALWDFNHETTLNQQWSFMPSAGIGFGYQWGNGVALGVEHRTTWALNDIIDGISHDVNGAATPNNDLYHYDGFFIRWTFGGNSDHSTTHTTTPPPPNPNVYTQNPPNTTTTNTTTVTNPPPNNTQTQQTTTTTNNTSPAPVVYFTTPAVDPYTTTVQTQQLVVRVEYVMYASQIQLLINNVVSTNFSFNPNTNTMVFNHVLQPGTNVYKVTATNSVGSAYDIQTIIYNEPNTTTTVTNPTPLPPTVNITNPPSDPYTSAVQTMSVYATVLNVTSAQYIQIRRNGNPLSNFTYDPNTHQVVFTANLQTGSNLYEVIGTNAVGSASDAVTINYNPAPVIAPPVVTITSPVSCPFQTKVQNMTITANITNVTMASQVSIVFNNQPVNIFNFVNHGSYATVSFNVNLNPGVNPFTITGTNAGGSDTKSCEVTYKVTVTAPPPVVTITNPATNPYTTTVLNMTLNATVLNVSGQNEISVALNNVNVTNFTYNPVTHVVAYNAQLQAGSNTWAVRASNANGTDFKSTVIIYKQVSADLPPVVNITIPVSNPFVTSNNQQGVTAQVLNVTSSNQITVRDDQNASLAFNFNAATHLVTFSPVLRRGTNTFTVTATNSAGSASDNVTIDIQGTPVDPHNRDTANDGGGNSHSSGGGSTTDPHTRPPGGGSTTVSGGHSSSSSSAVAITLVTPSTESSSTSSQVQAVSMNVTGVTSASDITVVLNGNTMPASRVNYSNGSLTFNATLLSGTNTIVVTAHNGSSTATRTLTITYTATGKTSNPSGGGKSSTSGKGSTSSGRGGTTTTTTKPGETTTTPSSTPRTTTTPSTTTTPRGGSSSSSSSETKPR